ncbi:helix-turn-helix domain-containing protein [Streptomyces yunnanensis]|uniref:Helix-turn-helix domain-containing protein n=1 Tax=Streptomyces yunnanensis TaxID=156453 RepID=A0ABY8A1G1_9ACTN|nr:helix-turn-helix domain-containing protein [Streptomyces yunnanensis]WEB38785.1 helix-turn-helix domain-containing protein [Streptomyces yunnanensis]
MTHVERTPGPGRNVATLRKERGLSQAQLARMAGVSLSMLSKIEVGDRPLTQGMGAALANAMGITLDEVLGKAPVTSEDNLKELRSAMRRFDLPGEPPVEAEALKLDLARLTKHRFNTELSEVLSMLPGLTSRVTNYAHAAGTPEAWAMVADTYSTIYWVAARHRWLDLAELASVKQVLAAERATTLVQVVAARDHAGMFLNGGDFAGGLAVVERAIVKAESTLTGPERAFGLGTLHLRGLTLAGRLRDKAEADKHIERAERLAGEFQSDVVKHEMHFGPQNAAVHIISTSGDLRRHSKALQVSNDLQRQEINLPATRVGPMHLDTARARLALGDRDGALDSLESAWAVAPQLAKVHPTSQELFRVLISLHKRSNPRLNQIAKRAKVSI